MSKSYLGGIHQRKQQAASPCCTIMSNASRDASICSTRPKWDVTSCRIKDRPGLMSCMGYCDLHNTTQQLDSDKWLKESRQGWWECNQKYADLAPFCVSLVGSPVEKVGRQSVHFLFKPDCRCYSEPFQQVIIDI